MWCKHTRAWLIIVLEIHTVEIPTLESDCFNVIACSYERVRQQLLVMKTDSTVLAEFSTML